MQISSARPVKPVVRKPSVAPAAKSAQPLFKTASMPVKVGMGVSMGAMLLGVGSTIFGLASGNPLFRNGGLIAGLVGMVFPLAWSMAEEKLK